MVRFIYAFGAPQYAYTFALKWQKTFALLSFLTLVTAFVWGFFFTPPDYQQGDAFRIIFWHVPAAFMSLFWYTVMASFALTLLVWRVKVAGLMLSILARLGLVMTLLALITGSLWGKPMWGTYWIWDARLTSEFILFLIYAGILGLHQALAYHPERDRLLAVFVLVGFLDLPVIHYSVYWWNSLHQAQTITLFAKPKIAAVMLYPLLISLLGFLFYGIFMIFTSLPSRILLQERQKVWVHRQLKGNI